MLSYRSLGNSLIVEGIGETKAWTNKEQNLNS